MARRRRGGQQRPRYAGDHRGDAPAAFTTALMDAAQARGAELRHGRVTGVARRATGSAAGGGEVDGELVRADAVVIALGPWSLLAAEWLPPPPLDPSELRMEPRSAS
nr:FAD-dependent oxidoreductase [Pseudonocardia acidicola]